MNQLQQGMLTDRAGVKLLSRGKALEELDDGRVIALARVFGADYVVLPTASQHKLEAVEANAQWVIYKPRVAPAKPATNRPEAFFASVSSGNVTAILLSGLDRYLHATYLVLPETPVDR